ncbi:hypothetical protein HOY82DRAFT_619457 [Tuber indicum]|nr:hypothetical protein HOY82DRAFT_619457 [Tuber indicum]
MESNSGDWSKSEIEQVVRWLEDLIKLRRTQKGSGETKKHWISAMASTISSRSEAQVGYKYDNLKKVYHEALKLVDQSGWGLGEEDLHNGNTLSLHAQNAITIDDDDDIHENNQVTVEFQSEIAYSRSSFVVHKR